MAEYLQSNMAQVNTHHSYTILCFDTSFLPRVSSLASTDKLPLIL